MSINRMPYRKHSEKALFITLWLILIVGYGLWKVRDTPHWNPKKENPKLHLNTGIKTLFEQAWVKQLSPTTIELGLKLNDSYRRRLEKEHSQLNIGFELRGGSTVLKRGVAPCLVTRDVAGTTLLLDNPDRISAKEIHLYLPH